MPRACQSFSSLGLTSKQSMNMSTLKIIQNLFMPTNPWFLHQGKMTRGRRSVISLCESSSGDSEGSSSPEGDKRKQELLAKIVQLQAEKVRVTDYLNERSSFLTQFAEDANVEFDVIAEDAFKGLDEAVDRITANIDSRMEAFEQSAEANREEIEKSDKELAELEEKMEEDRNVSLFFQNLGKKPSKEKVNPTQEIKKLKAIARETAGSKVRRSIYLALICLLVFTIVEIAISSPELDWRKVGALGAILMGLIAQLIYEQKMSSAEEDEKKL